MGQPAVYDVAAADPSIERVETGLDLGDHAGFDASFGDHLVGAPGVQLGDEGVWIGAVLEDAAPPDDLQSRHLWDDTFPTWETPGAVNVKAAPYGAMGDGETDDTSAIQQAIDDCDTVFLPRGKYLVSRTLRLRPTSKIATSG